MANYLILYSVVTAERVYDGNEYYLYADSAGSARMMFRNDPDVRADAAARCMVSERDITHLRIERVICRD